MKEESKSKISTYIVGAIVGAILVLVAGFWVGPLTTNGAVTEAVDVAVVEQQAQFCAERGRADAGYINAELFSELELSARRDFTTQFSEFEGQTAGNGRDVANACRGYLEAS